MTRDHQPPAHDRVEGGAWRSPRAWTALLLATFLGLAADLATKHIAFERIADSPLSISRAAVTSLDPREIQTLIPRHEPVRVIPHVLEFKLVLNPGAVFGIGAGKRMVFVVFTGIALAVGGWAFARWTRRDDYLSHAALGLIAAGGLGNVYDRLSFGCVRDFIHPLPTLRWPAGAPVWPYVSNVADAILIVGVGVLLIQLWRADRAERRDAQPREA